MKSVTKEELINFIKIQIAEVCDVPIETIGINQEFSEFKIDSLEAIAIMSKVEELLNIELNPIVFWQNPTIASFSSFILENFLHTKNS
jgi:polyketide synthase PksN